MPIVSTAIDEAGLALARGEIRQGEPLFLHRNIPRFEINFAARE
jgi:hypothetical protein